MLLDAAREVLLDELTLQRRYGLDQQIAEAIGVDRHVVSQWRHRHRVIPERYVDVLASALGLVVHVEVRRGSGAAGSAR